jgi:hypothetical protein
MSDTLERELGEISATLQGIRAEQTRQAGSLEKIDDRLRGVERKGAINGAVSGGVIAIAISLIKGSFPSA